MGGMVKFLSLVASLLLGAAGGLIPIDVQSSRFSRYSVPWGEGDEKLLLLWSLSSLLVADCRTDSVVPHLSLWEHCVLIPGKQQ